MSLGSQGVKNFYGPQCSSRVEKLFKKSTKSKVYIEPYITKDILNGPSTCWRVFGKQEDALNYSQSCKDGLMSFAFEPHNSTTPRLFLSAHPEVFWHYDKQRPSLDRCSYEIIAESSACKLYLDLEYDKMNNPHSKGSEMVEILINILLSALKRTWKVSCSSENVLNLEASTEKKFSHHLIFNIPKACFINNRHVGYFLRTIHRDMMESIILESSIGLLESTPVSDMKKLLIKDAKGNETWFCDLSVYSRNRHFRLYSSTKRGKNAPLILSKDNKHPITGELQTFLSSLVTYVNSDCKILEWTEKPNTPSTPYQMSTQHLIEPPTSTSPFPLVDTFINNTVRPGRIYRTAYFSTRKTIVYDIVGNRFCGNINRQHKNNNVKYIVDLTKYEFYQKCYDYECSGYRSPPTSLPSEIIFQISDNSDVSKTGALGIFDLQDEDASDLIDAIEMAGMTEFSQFSEELVTSTANLTKFPSFGLSDEAFESIEY